MKNFVKRSLDSIISTFVLIIMSPVILSLWIIIVLNDGLPGFFKQIRVGKDGVDFVLYKLRTMKIDNESSKGIFRPGNTNRVTNIGQWLRRWKLDEIPQFYNVLKGDLSLVGPRPEVRFWIDIYHERWEKILRVRPGITDAASIEFRNEEQLLATSDNPKELYENVILPRKLDIYEEYVSSYTVKNDIKLLFQTFIALSKGK